MLYTRDTKPLLLPGYGSASKNIAEAELAQYVLAYICIAQNSAQDFHSKHLQIYTNSWLVFIPGIEATA